MKKTSKFNPTMYVTAYQMARDGLSNVEISTVLGIHYDTFRKYLRLYPALVDALKRGRYNRKPGDEYTFQEYVYDHLSKEVRAIWDKLVECEGLDSPYDRVEALLARQGVCMRQRLFLHALTQSMFNASAALRRLHLSKDTLDNWKHGDPDFAILVEEINWHKDNFFEQAFIGRVAAGDTNATIHAVRTRCRHRGYNDKIEIEHTGTVSHAITIDMLDLDTETKNAVLEALRRHQAARQLPAPPINDRLATISVN